MSQPLLVTMSGPDGIDLDKVNDFEAGLAFLNLVGKVYPDATFGDLPYIAAGIPANARMAGWLTDIRKTVTKSVGSVKDGIGDALKSTFKLGGEAAGSAVRLVTDEKVLDGASRIGAAYATYGGSEGFAQVMQSATGGDKSMVDSLVGFIASLGQTAKSQPPIMVGSAAGFGGVPGNMLPWLIGAGVLVAVLALRPAGRR